MVATTGWWHSRTQAAGPDCAESMQTPVGCLPDGDVGNMWHCLACGVAAVCSDGDITSVLALQSIQRPEDAPPQLLPRLARQLPSLARLPPRSKQWAAADANAKLQRLKKTQEAAAKALKAAEKALQQASKAKCCLSLSTMV